MASEAQVQVNLSGGILSMLIVFLPLSHAVWKEEGQEALSQALNLKCLRSTRLMRMKPARAALAPCIKFHCAAHTGLPRSVCVTDMTHHIRILPEQEPWCIFIVNTEPGAQHKAYLININSVSKGNNSGTG